ncbi:MAG: hypothetical protein KatS3mg105_4429 [Gemmatales bacterium]|nr:MAG: hypothetical protein KatS3mg105_4429 [Gemmatales bacterium]
MQLEVPVNKPTPLPEPAAPKSAEDEIAAMLLAMSEDEEEEPVNQDTTIVDMDALLTHQDEPAQPTRPTSKKSDRNKGKSDTQAAAEEILARFQRRNRR